MEKTESDGLSLELTTCKEEESPDSMADAEIHHQQRGQQQQQQRNPAVTTLMPQRQPSVQNDREEINTSGVLEEIRQLPKEIRNIVAGGLAGMTAKSFVAPFDRIKILYQVSSAEFHIMNVPSIAKKITQEEGLSALWKGNTATLIRVFPYAGIQFMVFDRWKTYFMREQENNYMRQKAINPNTPKPSWGLSPLESLGAGMAAGGISVVATYPLDLTRSQLAVLKTKKGRSSSNMGFGAALLSNYRDRGAIGLFRGITPTIMGILPYSGLAFSFNEQAKRKIQSMTGRDLTTIERMQCGGLSGLVAQTVTYPLEVTRRRMQTIGIVPTSGKDAAVDVVGKHSSRNPAAERAIRLVKPGRPPSMSSIVKELYQEQGVRGFFKGVTLNWFKGPISFSISFTCFDTMQNFMARDSERRVFARRKSS